MTIEIADFSDPSLIALLELHMAGMFASTPPEGVHALDLEAIQSPDVSLFVFKRAGKVIAMGAIKELDAAWGELKSMRTHPDYVRQGIAAAILENLIAEARRRGYRRLSLETGKTEDFQPALALYRRYGFVSGGPFADYIEDAYSQFLHLDLD